MERRERSKAEIYMDGRVRLYESTRWITINCSVLGMCIIYTLGWLAILGIQALIFGKRCFVAMSGV